jgi:hypothetical protein
MKKILILLTINISIVLASSLSSAEITNMISKIKEKREGITLDKLSGTSNPFLIKVKKKALKKEDKPTILMPTVVEEQLNLTAILNHAAFINKKWYKFGDKVGSYRVGYVSRHSVTLKSVNGNKTLRLKKKNRNFIKLKKGYR